MKIRFDVGVHGRALSFEVSLYRAMDLKYRNNNGEINFIEPSRDQQRGRENPEMRDRVKRRIHEKKGSKLIAESVVQSTGGTWRETCDLNSYMYWRQSEMLI